VWNVPNGNDATMTTHAAAATYLVTFTKPIEARWPFDARCDVTPRHSSTPTNTYSNAIAKNDFSIPASGNRTKPATRDPSAAPIVLASVSTPAVAISDVRLSRSAAPTIGKNMPETNDTGNISGRLTRRIASGCVIEESPNGSMTERNWRY